MPSAKRPRRNSSKDNRAYQAISAAVAEAGVPQSVREMLSAGLHGCLDSSSSSGKRHHFQNLVLGAVLEALEMEEASLLREVEEIAAAIAESEAELFRSEASVRAMTLELDESGKSIENEDVAFGESLESARQALAAAESSLRRKDTDIGEAVMNRCLAGQALERAKSLLGGDASDDKDHLESLSQRVSELDDVIAHAGEARVRHVAEASAARETCSKLLSDRAAKATELAARKVAHSQREVSLKLGTEEAKKAVVKRDLLLEKMENTRQRLACLRKGALAECRSVTALTEEVRAAVRSVESV